MGDLTLTATKVREVGDFGNIKVPGDANEALSIGNIVQLDSSTKKWKKTDADTAAGVKGAVGMVISGAQGQHHNDGAIAAGERIAVLLFGLVELGSDQTLDVTKQLYASGTAGAMTDAAPTQSRALATPISTTTILFNPRIGDPGSI